MISKASLQRRLDKAIDVLNSFGILPSEDEASQMAELLDDVVEINPPKVTAIGRVMQYMGSFNELVRDEIKDIRLASRYEKITSLFDSIVNDAKALLGQIEDGKIDWKEKVSGFWMKLVRGGIPKRFERIKNTYNDVARDTRSHLGREERILAAYQEFRGAIKEAEALAYEVKGSQEKNLGSAKEAHAKAEEDLKAKEGGEAAEVANYQLARDEAFRALQEEEKKLYLLTDLAEHLKVGYNVAETVMAKLQQTHDAKEQVYNRSVTFFGTNEHVFTVLAATYTSQLGLHESTQTLDAMTDGVNKSLEMMAEIGGTVEERALEAAHGPTVRAEALQKLVDAVVEFQTTSRSKIKELREANTANVHEIERIVEDGKQRARQAVERYVAA
jgi:hypothetical protein